MTQPFNQPFDEPSESGDRFTAEDAQNKRLIIIPIEYVPQIRTQRQDVVDGIRVNVVDLDSGGTVHNGAIWFGGRLIAKMRPKIGGMFLGYIAKQATQGGFKAWEFFSLTQDQYTSQLARDWLAQHPEFVETSKGDVQMAATNPTKPPQQQGQQPWPQAPGGQPSQWSASYQQQGQPWPPSTYQGNWTPPQGPPPPPGPPVPSQGPPLPPAPPAQVSPPAPPGPPAPASGPPTAPQAPPVPPGQMSVMDRLRAAQQASSPSAEGQSENPDQPAQGQLPF